MQTGEHHTPYIRWRSLGPESFQEGFSREYAGGLHSVSGLFIVVNPPKNSPLQQGGNRRGKGTGWTGRKGVKPP